MVFPDTLEEQGQEMEFGSSFVIYFVKLIMFRF